MVGIIPGGISMDIEVNKEQGKDEKHGNGHADCYSDPGVVRDTVGRGAGGTKVGKIRWRLESEDVRRFYGERERRRRLALACIFEGIEN